MQDKDSSALVESLEALSKELPKRLNGDVEEEALRLRALDLAAKLTKDLQSPYEFFMAQGLAPVESIGIVIAVDLDLFNTIANHNGPIKITDITSSTKGDEVFVQRIVRFLAAHRLIDQLDKDTYIANQRTRDMLHEHWIALHRKFLFCHPAYSAAPEFLAKINHQNPDNPADGPWQFGLQTNQDFWQYMRAQPDLAVHFNNLMKVPRNRFPDQLVEDYPFEKLFEGSTSSDILFADVGGGYGHQCMNLRQSFGVNRGRIMLQDLPEVIEGKTIEDVEVMVHDMTHSQPVAGARAYYFRGICHDHNDDVCRTFLSQTKKAMNAESRLLVHEQYVADVDPTEYITRMDLTMMTLFTAMERSELQMMQLLESVGFKVLGQHSSPKSRWKIIEASL